MYASELLRVEDPEPMELFMAMMLGAKEPEEEAVYW